MAVERIAAGAGTEIAEEIGANKYLVAVWVRNAQHKNPVSVFFGVIPLTGVKPGHGPGVAVAAADTVCRISIGDADIAIPLGYPADHLAEVLRAVRASK